MGTDSKASTLVIVWAHGGVLDTFNRHKPYWESHRCPIRVLSPANDPVPCEYEQISVGKSEHHGYGIQTRAVEILRYITSTNYDQFLMFEFDSICLEPAIPVATAFHGNMQINQYPMFRAKWYSNAPWLFTKFYAKRMEDALPSFSDTLIGMGFNDRLWSELLFKFHLSASSHSPVGFSNDTIRKSDHPALRKCIMNGGTMIHGIKDEPTLRLVERFRRDFLASPRKPPKHGWAKDPYGKLVNQYSTLAKKMGYK